MNKAIITNLELINQLEQANEEENSNFLNLLKSMDGSLIDPLVHSINREVSESIDCTTCGNCCRSLMINVEEGEPEELSGHLNISLQELKDKYIEESQQGRMIVNAIPCHFLSGNKCTIYEYRFNECKEFPHLHKPGFIKRFPGTVMHYGRCPIIYNVVKELKSVLHFELSAER